MSTRSLTGLTFDGRRLFQYCHSDGYPDYLGRKTLDWVKLIADEEATAAVLASARRLIEVDEVGDPLPDERVALASYWKEVSTGEDWYSLLRETQGSYPDILASGHIMSLSRKPETFGQGGWSDIEWSYEVDLDERRFTTYEGEPNDDRMLRFSFDALPSVDTYLVMANALAAV